jgi:internalin A
MEQNGLQTLPKVVENAVLTLDVQALLNGVDLEGTRPRPRASNALGQTLRLFYSYAHKDEPLRDELEIHLKILQRRGLIESWYDRKIDAGDDWKRQIDTHLERADIFLLLLSPDFIASDYCWNIEMQRALERHKAGEAQVIPIIVRDVQWQEALPLTVQALPKDGKAITTWLDRDTAWRNVSEGIEQVVHRLRHKRMHP